MKSLYITLLSAAMSLSVGASAQTTEAVLDLTDRTTFDNCTQTSIKYDHNEYNAWTFNNYGKYPYMYNSGICYHITADYFICLCASSCIKQLNFNCTCDCHN